MTMLHKTQLIVLHTIKYSDSSLLVYAYTQLFGRQTYLLKGIRTAKKHGLAAHFFPLHPLEAVVDHDPGRDIQYIKEFHRVVDLSLLRTQLHKSALALFIGELLYKSLQENAPNPELYHFIKQAIFTLNTLESGLPNFHLHFMVQLAIYSGYSPLQNYHPQQAPYFDYSQGGFCAQPSFHSFPADESLLLHRLLSQPKDFALWPLDQSVRNRFVADMARYLGYHMGVSLALKSPEILHQVLSAF